nr:MAG TPA: hypothetical protein [Caudoviricetes sp.]
MTNTEFERVLNEERKQRYYYSDLLDLHEDSNRSFSCEFITEEDYPDDWYCAIYYDVTTHCEGSNNASSHNVEIQHIYINFQEVKVTEMQESILTTVLTNRANKEFQFKDTDIHPDYATSKMW